MLQAVIYGRDAWVDNALSVLPRQELPASTLSISDFICTRIKAIALEQTTVIPIEATADALLFTTSPWPP